MILKKTFFIITLLFYSVMNYGSFSNSQYKNEYENSAGGGALASSSSLGARILQRSCFKDEKDESLQDLSFSDSELNGINGVELLEKSIFENVNSAQGQFDGGNNASPLILDPNGSFHVELEDWQMNPSNLDWDSSRHGNYAVFKHQISSEYRKREEVVQEEAQSFLLILRQFDNNK